jgi:hypothetical protein
MRFARLVVARDYTIRELSEAKLAVRDLEAKLAETETALWKLINATPAHSVYYGGKRYALNAGSLLVEAEHTAMDLDDLLPRDLHPVAPAPQAVETPDLAEVPA